MDKALEALSKKELLDLIDIFSKNWLTVDGLWFGLVEETYGLDAALDLDLKMWKRNAAIEADRVKRYLGIEGGGIQGFLKALHFMSFNPCMPYEYLPEGPNQGYLVMPICRPQEGRLRAGKGEFPCKPVGFECYAGIASKIDSRVKVECVFCPPDEHPPDLWCKWKLTYVAS
jgi:hypothetical protein